VRRPQPARNLLSRLFQQPAGYQTLIFCPAAVPPSPASVPAELTILHPQNWLLATRSLRSYTNPPEAASNRLLIERSLLMTLGAAFSK
jgi:hypothetical protein